jgi:phosphatidylserine/phosphatidylglycerophosphate/cardiolipin synthase-like enzyme/uncharacterized membrane protein YdjX (TVP38/TMEM64 family)
MEFARREAFVPSALTPMPDSPAPSILRLDRNCCAITHTDRVKVLVDAEDYFAAFAAACERAERSIVILGWDFDSRTPLRFDDRGQASVCLGDFLNDLCHRRRALRIRILDWDYPMIFGRDREFPPLYGLTWSPHRHVHFHYDDTHPLAGSHHQKIVVVDDKLAFVGGLDLTSRRWDTRDHRADDPRRTAGGKPYPPFHDIMIALDGEAATAVATVARKRWTAATGHELPPVKSRGDPWPPSVAPDHRDARIGLACTAPASEKGAGTRDIEQLYLDMIDRAERYIYIENQYFTAQSIGRALARRLAEESGPEIVVVTRLLSHGWLEEMTMHVLRTKLIRELRAADRHGRFSVYYPFVQGLAEGTCLDVHSKAMIVDDEWLRIGSSNISNRSMGLDSECDVLVEAEGRDDARRFIRGVRDGLLAEHLGVPVATLEHELERRDTLRAAIDACGSPERDLRPLEDMPEYSDAMISTAALADPEKPVSIDALVEQFAPEVEPDHARPAWPKIAAVAGVLLALTLVWRFTPLAELLTPERVTDWVRAVSGNWWAPVVLMLAYTPASYVMFPRPLLTLAAVVGFGPWLGFTYAMSGILLAAASHYLVGRWMHRDTVRRIAGERLNRMTNALRHHGLVAVTALRLVPLAPFAVEGIVGGAIRFKAWQYMAGTFLGMLPGVLAATVFADQLESGLEDPSTVNWWLVAGVVAALVTITWLVRRWFTRLEARHPPVREKQGKPPMPRPREALAKRAESTAG